MLSPLQSAPPRNKRVTPRRKAAAHAMVSLFSGSPLQRHQAKAKTGKRAREDAEAAAAAGGAYVLASSRQRPRLVRGIVANAQGLGGGSGAFGAAAAAAMRSPAGGVGSPMSIYTPKNGSPASLLPSPHGPVPDMHAAMPTYQQFAPNPADRSHSEPAAASRKAQPTYSRKDKSLGLLCTRFLAAFDSVEAENAAQADKLIAAAVEKERAAQAQLSASGALPPLAHGRAATRAAAHAATKGKDVCLDKAAELLGVERRRIYDIVNILESVEIVCRKAKNLYTWHGRGRLPFTLALLKAEAEIEADAVADEAAGDREAAAAARVEAHAIRMRLRVGNKDKSLGRLSQKFLQLFLMGDQVVSLESAAKQLIAASGEKNDSGSLLKTKVRRLYDIANVLATVDLIEKVQMAVDKRKPAFRWTGRIEPMHIDDVPESWPNGMEAEAAAAAQAEAEAEAEAARARSQVQVQMQVQMQAQMQAQAAAQTQAAVAAGHAQPQMTQQQLEMIAMQSQSQTQAQPQPQPQPEALPQPPTQSLSNESPPHGKDAAAKAKAKADGLGRINSDGAVGVMSLTSPMAAHSQPPAHARVPSASPMAQGRIAMQSQAQHHQHQHHAEHPQAPAEAGAEQVKAETLSAARRSTPVPDENAPAAVAPSELTA